MIYTDIDDAIAAHESQTFAAWSKQQDADGRQTICFDDLLETGPLSVDGVTLDATVEVTLSREHRRDVPTLQSFGLCKVYLHVESYPDLLELDFEQFRTRHKALYKAFLCACESYAVKRASEAPDGDWTSET